MEPVFQGHFLQNVKPVKQILPEWLRCSGRGTGLSEEKEKAKVAETQRDRAAMFGSRTGKAKNEKRKKLLNELRELKKIRRDGECANMNNS